jgi:hypothetical protein
MQDADDWDYVLDTVEALFYRVANGLVCRADMSLADAHEEMWILFGQGYFKLAPTDDGGVGVVPCTGDEDRHAAMAQNKPLANYRQRVIEEAVAAA